MQFIEHNNIKYIVDYKKSLQYMTDEESNEYRNKCGYDICFKNNEAYHFCYKIEDAVEVIEETTGNNLDTYV